MGIKQLYNDHLRKLPNEYGDVSVMFVIEDDMSDFAYQLQFTIKINFRKGEFLQIYV